MDTIWHTFWTYILFRKRQGVHWAVLGSVLPDIINLFAIGVNFVLYGFNWQTYVAPVMPTWTLVFNYAAHSLLVITILGIILFVVARSLLPLCYGLGFHALLDYMTHHTDAYPPFYPLSEWKFVSPISYWEDAYYSNEVMLIHLVLATFVIGYLFFTIKKPTVIERSLFLFGVGYFVMLTSFYAINHRTFELLINGIVPLLLFIVFFVKTLRKWPFFTHTS